MGIWFPAMLVLYLEQRGKEGVFSYPALGKLTYKCQRFVSKKETDESFYFI